ncbi:hypothetical protein [Aureibaculum luteum]|uniref:hypothetical protein n=1 Tax=Aureibaculum luteum TaxID=1548456 RepID=UPI000E54F3EC|nr:hypothetical protein [Aureibaculum luteum]
MNKKKNRKKEKKKFQKNQKSVNNEDQRISSKSKRTNFSLILSILALVISFVQLLFTMPLVLKYYDKVEIQVHELGLTKLENYDNIFSQFKIKNIGENTAKNVEFRLRVLNGDSVRIVPKVFNLLKVDSSGIITKDSFYGCDEIVPSESVRIIITSDFSNFLKLNRIDTLFYNKAIDRYKVSTGPYIWDLKHSLGRVKVIGSDSLTLKKRWIYELN